MSWDEYNPHDEAEPYLRTILRQINGRLAPSLHRLVSILRDTLPIIVVLEDIRKNDEARGKSIDTFAKSAGWYRLLYSDMRYV
jgi:mediator of RNA polymerase II transcription subunit 14